MNTSRNLTRLQRVMFLGFALLSMIFLATASVEMAAKHIAECIVLFLLAVLTIGTGFMMRKRTFK